LTRKKANIGDIWLVLIPRILYDDSDESIDVKLEKRPCLIIDDGRGFIIEENSNYSALKLTTRESNLETVRRKEITNWKELGLKKKSYVRIELPIKIEPEQLIFKITEMSNNEIASYLKDLANYFNVDVLEKLSN
jgi:hypothetical protein